MGSEMCIRDRCWRYRTGRCSWSDSRRYRFRCSWCRSWCRCRYSWPNRSSGNFPGRNRNSRCNYQNSFQNTPNIPGRCWSSPPDTPGNRLNIRRRSLPNSRRSSWYSRPRTRNIDILFVQHTPSKSSSHTIGPESGARPACPVPVCCIALSKNSSSPRSAP